MPNFILCKFAAIQTSQRKGDHAVGGWTGHGNFKKTEEVSYPLREMDQYEDQSKDILNSILQEELSDSDSEALIEELWADEVS